MAGETILIAAFSGRALAQSARRAGLEPLVVDCFADEDMIAAACASRRVPASLRGGFEGKALLGALEELQAGATSRPIGLVLGAGFEGTPKLLSTLAERFDLVGNPAAVVERTKNPLTFFGVLDRLGIRHPETSVARPGSPEGWLRKRVGGSGGIHITDCSKGSRALPRHYFQRRIEGQSISALGVLGPSSTAFAFSRQWTAPTRRQPYRYGGAVGAVAVDEDLEGRLIDISMAVAAELELRGLVSFDYIVDDGEPFLIEVNPRPGASLDVFDDGQGTLLQAHIEGCRPGGDPAAILAAQWAPPLARAAAYLYADRGTIEIPAVDWPPWTADRPRSGSMIEENQPVATVFADAGTSQDAERLCRERLGSLEAIFYDRTQGKETQ